MNWWRTRRAPPPATPTTAWRRRPATPTGSRRSTSTGRASVLAGTTSTRRRPPTRRASWRSSVGRDCLEAGYSGPRRRVGSWTAELTRPAGSDPTWANLPVPDGSRTGLVGPVGKSILARVQMPPGRLVKTSCEIVMNGTYRRREGSIEFRGGNHIAAAGQTPRNRRSGR